MPPASEPTQRGTRATQAETYQRNKPLWENLRDALAALDAAGEEIELDPGEEFVEDPALAGYSGRVYFANGWFSEPN
ncbi:hypothetical protein [Streptomyces sp. NPDC020667]|uniref:hypothetical protein n=1 Tax=Streptomyces sp. NPDC020667 TaxID=3154895 RepID=UPI0033EA6222